MSDWAGFVAIVAMIILGWHLVFCIIETNQIVKRLEADWFADEDEEEDKSKP